MDKQQSGCPGNRNDIHYPDHDHDFDNPAASGWTPTNFIQNSLGVDDIMVTPCQFKSTRTSFARVIPGDM